MSSIRLKLLLVAAAAAMGLGCAQFAGVSTLRGSHADTADQVPDLKEYAGKRPGAGQPISRTFKQQPPLVPHAVDNFDEITVADNQCLECHAPDKAEAKKAPKVAIGHLVREGGNELRMERYQCNSCHVPQVNAPPLVANTFVGNAPTP